MSEVATTKPPPSPWRRFLWIAAPIVVFLFAVAWILTAEPLKSINSGAPPVEKLTFERTILDENGLRLLVRAGGSQPMTIAQVQVDDAYWQFTQEPPGRIARGGAVWLSIPFPWVLGEAHVVKVVTDTGATFEHEIGVAVPTPTVTIGQMRLQAIVGGIVGIVPVAIGLMFYPVLQQLGESGMRFLLALTVGLLGFLFIDTFLEAVEQAGETAAIFQGATMVVLAGLASFLILMAVGRRGGAPTGLALATCIALGIGMHNLGEGLAIGAAFAAGSAGLGTFLVLGFALHNITEGIGIAAPILKIRPPLWAFGALTLLAGGPAVIGIWLGSLAQAPQWSALALAVGAGAILQVIVEMSAYLMRAQEKHLDTFVTPPVLGGLVAGVALMYATAALVRI